MGLDDAPLQMPTLKDSDIRPSDLMVDQAALFRSDVERLVAHAAEFVSVNCPACTEPTSTPRFAKMGLSYVTCTSCATTYTSPRPKPEHLREYYETSENYKYWATEIFPASEPARRDRIFRPRVERVLELCDRFGIKPDVLMEVGPGFGTFCEEVLRTRRFTRVLAVEPTPDLAEACRRRGIEVIEKPVEEVDVSALPAVSVIASFETIEHLYEPESFVRACFSLLSPGGLLVLTCPNGQGFEVEELGEHADTVDAEHLNYFNPSSLSSLVSRVGFDPLETSTPGRLDAELVRKKALAGDWSTTSPFLRRVLLDDWERLGPPFQDYLAANNLSSHMWLVARKPLQERT